MITKKEDKPFFSTNATSNKHAVQRWANFVAGFSVEFVLDAIKDLSGKQTILDPFMGTGTTALGARMLGHDAVGYEAHPLFATLAECKTQEYSLTDVDEVERKLLSPCKPLALSRAADLYLTKMFDEKELPHILSASVQVSQMRKDIAPLAVAIFLKATEAACGAKTDGIYKAPTSKKKSLGFAEALSKSLHVFREDISSADYRSLNHGTQARIIPQSSTSMHDIEENSIAAVVTSPPYLNNFDFAEMTRMQLYLLGWASSWSEITDLVRSTQITNTTTSLKGKKTLEYQTECRALLPNYLVKDLDPLVTDLEGQRAVRKGKKDYDYLVYPYYRQIQEVIVEMHRVMKAGAPVHWVVSDAALYGVYLETQEHTAALMRTAGFEDVEIKLIRRRGHRWKLEKRDGAPGRLGEYHIVGTKA
jgi:DNA modification methylase